MSEYKILTPSELALEIKSKAHWRVLIRPKEYMPVRIKDARDLSGLIAKCNVELRGWDYPHWSHHEEERIRTGQYFSNCVDWDYHREIWRFYRSGQFVHIRSLWEEDEVYRERLRSSVSQEAQRTAAKGFIDIDGLVWTVTEICAFASRLATNPAFDTGATISVSIMNADGYLLSVNEPGRWMTGAYTLARDHARIRGGFAMENLVSDYKAIASEMTKELFGEFGYEPSDQYLAAMQERLVARNH